MYDLYTGVGSDKLGLDPVPLWAKRLHEPWTNTPKRSATKMPTITGLKPLYVASTEKLVEADLVEFSAKSFSCHTLQSVGVMIRGRIEVYLE